MIINLNWRTLTRLTGSVYIVGESFNYCGALDYFQKLLLYQGRF